MNDLARRKKELLNAYNNLCSCYGDIISEQTKTINHLEELLKECMNMFVKMYETNTVNSVFLGLYENIKTKIDNVIGEKY